MLAGYPPFYDDNPFGIYEKILSGKIEWAKHLDPVAKDLIKKLLVQDRTKRLGNMKVVSVENVLSLIVLIKSSLVLCSAELKISRGIGGSKVSIGKTSS